MARQGATETDKRVKGLHQCDRAGGREGLRRRRRRRGRKMSAVAFVAPSGDVMFATSLQLSGHPSSLPCPPSPSPAFNAAPHSISSSPFTHTPPPPTLETTITHFFLLAVVTLSLSCHSVNTPYSRSLRKP